MNTKKVTRTAAFTAVAILLGYVESLFPPIAAGVKLGLANTVVITVLYTQSTKEAWAVAIMKAILCAALFGSASSFVYSFSGAIISLLVMIIAKKSNLFSLIAVSSLGGIFHNMAQLLCAYFFIGKGVLFYIPVLFVSGALCGILTGIAAKILVKRGIELFGKE
ncbi:MAG: Gx transporter family protein [Clostridia bacterium]|nr:Gx transporter family protein [Clostridia bacterium]